jgi:predicted transcriptional regulator
MPDSDDEAAAAILREATAGKPLREIAKAHGLLQSEVNRILGLAAQAMFPGEGTRREVG